MSFIFLILGFALGAWLWPIICDAFDIKGRCTHEWGSWENTRLTLHQDYERVTVSAQKRSCKICNLKMVREI